MKIVYVITGLGLGGAERQVCDLADSMVASRHDVSIISLTGETIVFATSKSISVYELKMKKNPFSFVKALCQARKIIVKTEPDIVHAHMIHANIFSRILRIFVPIKKLICTAHSNNEGGRLRMLAYRLTDNLSDINTNVSKDALDRFQQIKAFPDSSKCMLVYNGIDTNKFIFSSISRKEIRSELNINNEFLFVAVGRLFEVKNYPNLINAFKLVFSKYQEAKLIIVGRGPLEEDLKEMVSGLGLQDAITFLGARNDVSAIMSAADCFVSSSDYEGTSLVILESMSCECFVISTDCGGTREAVKKFGFVVPIRNSQLLANRMMYVINMNEEAREIQVANAREHTCLSFSLVSIANQWLDIYKNKRIMK